MSYPDESSKTNNIGAFFFFTTLGLILWIPFVVKDAKKSAAEEVVRCALASDRRYLIVYTQKILENCRYGI